MQEYKKPKAKVISPTNRGTTGMIKAPKRRRWTGRAVAKKRMDEMKRHKHDHSPACAEKFAERIEGDIKRAVPHIVAVMGDGAHLPFAYTIGNTSKDLPELLMIGYHDAGAIGSVLGKLSDAMIEREHAFADGETVNLGGKYPVKIIDANATAQDKYTIQAGRFYGHEDYDVQQVLVSDRRGRFPDDAQCDAHFQVPVLARQGTIEFNEANHAGKLIRNGLRIARCRCSECAVREGECCACCGSPWPQSFEVPDRVWRHYILSLGDGDKVLCLDCFKLIVRLTDDGRYMRKHGELRMWKE
jgi:hypothetical protein